MPRATYPLAPPNQPCGLDISEEPREAKSTAFHGLLQSLGEEHDRQLGALQKEIVELQRRLEEMRGAAACSVMPSSEERGGSLGGEAQACQSSGELELLAPDTGPMKLSPATGNDSTLSSSLAVKPCQSVVPVQAFPLRPVWTSMSNSCSDGSTPLANKSSAVRGRSFVVPTGSSYDTTSCCARRLMLPPNSNARIAWDTGSILAIAFDLVIIPLQVFSLPKVGVLLVMEWITRIFWTLDVPASFCFGFYKEGEIVISPARTAWHYATTWLLVDLLILGVDWFGVIVDPDDSSGAANVSRTVRATRVVRTVRLLRLLKLKRVLEEVQYRMDSETICILFKISLYIVYVLAINHFVACAWYGISSLEFEEGWTDATFFPDASFEFRYTTAMHWSIAQFSMGSMDVHPRGPYERAFAIVVLLFALVVFSGLVGSITEALAQVRQINNKHNTQMWLLRRFLKEHRVSKDLSTRIIRYCQYASEHREQRLQERDVEVLGLLSRKLHDELQYEKHACTLSVHKLFKALLDDTESSRTMHRICSSAITMVEVIRNEVLFSIGEEALAMYFITDGSLSYQTSDDIGGMTSSVSVGEWACEIVLWVSWICVGDLFAKTECRLLSIDAQRFSEIILREQPPTLGLLRSYAAAFHESLSHLGHNQVTELIQIQVRPSAIMGSIVTVERSSAKRDSAKSSTSRGQALRRRVSLLK
mmetsp:Transcript_70209/g.227291  ORF Transcript_70209/g.227291 Transcript_70209/m.227291 type:complete len:704 (+) Transcript_70209:54-2165(+)